MQKVTVLKRYTRETNFKMKHPCSNQAYNCFSKDGNCPKMSLRLFWHWSSFRQHYTSALRFTQSTIAYIGAGSFGCLFSSLRSGKTPLCEKAKAALYTSPPLEKMHYKAITEKTSALSKQCSKPTEKVFSFTVHSLLSLPAVADHCSENTCGHFYNIRAVVFSRE